MWYFYSEKLNDTLSFRLIDLAILDKKFTRILGHNSRCYNRVIALTEEWWNGNQGSGLISVVLNEDSKVDYKATQGGILKLPFE